GVDLDTLDAGFAAQVAVVVVLAAFLTYDRPLRYARESAHLELGFGDLADVAEHLRGHRPVEVVADRDRLLNHAGVVVLALGEHGQRPRAGVGLDGHGRVGNGRAPLDDERLDLARAHFQERAEAPIQREPRRPRRRQRGGHDLDRVGRAARDDHAAFAVDDAPARRRSVKTAGATIELTTTPSTIWRSSCRLTGASTPSMNSTIV